MMNKRDRFSRQEYSMEAVQRHSAGVQKPPVSKKVPERPRAGSTRRDRSSVGERSVDSCNNLSIASKGSRLSELCDEDKVKIGNLIQRLAEETEAKRKAEDEVARVKNMYVKELDSLRDQNMKLAENTKMIEERYKEVSELAKRALKPAALAKESPISIEDSAEARREAAAQKRSPKVGHKPPQSVALVEPSDELHGRGESTKTLPKKPPLKAAKEKTKKKVPKSIPAISDRMEPSPPLCELKPNSASRRDHKPPAEAPGQKPGGRYLLPRRGDSLDRLQNTDSDADEDKPALNARASQEEHEAERHRRAIARATKKELSRRESAKQNTLSDILRLKAEINEVTNTLKGVEIEQRQEDVLRCKKQFQKELNHRLEEYQCLASKNSDMRELEDEEYMKSLRAAYEESSSDEDELAKRALDRKKDSLNCTGHSRVAKQAEFYQRAGYGATNRLADGHEAEVQDDYEEEPYRARVALPKQAKREVMPHAYNSGGGQFTNSRLQAAQKQKAFVRQRSLDTSEEDDPDQPRRPDVKAGRPKRQPSGLGNLDDMTEDQLALVKKMVESRLEDKAQAPKLSSRPRRRPEEPEVRLDDDFYDDKFLSLVYEMESQKDDSFINY